MKIHLVEDNKELSEWLQKALSNQGHEVQCSYDGLIAMDLQKHELFDAVIMDLQLPSKGGKSIIDQMRQSNDKTPILVLTANGSLSTKVETFDLGADDFLVKPFELEELEVRLRALVRRSGSEVVRDIICGDLSYSKDTQLFKLRDENLLLGPREHDVLFALIHFQGQTVSKKKISQMVSKEDEFITDDAIEIYVHRLRKKIEMSNCKIGTLRGLGYILNAQ